MQRYSSPFSQGPGKLQQSSSAPGAGGLPVPCTLASKSCDWLSLYYCSGSLLTLEGLTLLTEVSPTAALGKTLFSCWSKWHLHVHLAWKRITVHYEAQSIRTAICHWYFCQRLAVPWNAVSDTVGGPAGFSNDTHKGGLGLHNLRSTILSLLGNVLYKMHLRSVIDCTNCQFVAVKAKNRGRFSHWRTRTESILRTDPLSEVPRAASHWDTDKFLKEHQPQTL